MNLNNIYNNFTSYQILITVCFSIILFFLILEVNNILFKNENVEEFTQNDKYICKTNNEIFDLQYLQLYDMLYTDDSINNFIFDKISEYIGEKKVNNWKTKPSLKYINFLIIWTMDENFVKLFNKFNHDLDLIHNNYKTTKEICVQNDFLVSYFKKICNCNTHNKDLLTSFSFDNNSFSHIILNNINIYKLSFNDQIKFLDNICYWCKADGYLIIYLLDENIFNSDDKNPLLNHKNSPNIANGNINTNNFNINTILRYGDKNAKYKNISVKEEIEIKDRQSTKKNKKRVYEYCLNITPKNKLIKKILNCNFHIVNKYSLNIVEPYYENHYLYIFKKNNTNNSYNEF